MNLNARIAQDQIIVHASSPIRPFSYSKNGSLRMAVFSMQELNDIAVLNRYVIETDGITCEIRQCQISESPRVRRYHLRAGKRVYEK